MARILLFTNMNKGYINPYIPVAQELVRKGHTVAWLTIPGRVPGLAVPGVTFVEMDDFGQSQAAAPAKASEHTLGAARVRICARYIDAIPAHVERILRLVDSFKPDVIACAGRLYQAVVAAHCAKIPYACISGTLRVLQPPEVVNQDDEVLTSLLGERARMFERFSMPLTFLGWEYISPHANGVFTTRRFAGGLPLLPNFHLLGPVMPAAKRGDEEAFPWERLATDRPIIYVSFGSVHEPRPRLLEPILAAARPLGQVVLSAGALLGSSFAQTLPPDVLAVRYVPQLQLLERATVFVSHGGANSVMESMFHGVPMLVVPLATDQPLQAFLVQRAEVGSWLSPEAVTEPACSAALKLLLQPSDAARAALAEVKASYRQHDGALATERVLMGLMRSSPAPQ